MRAHTRRDMGSGGEAMMGGYASDPPLCPICQQKHFGVDHVWQKDEKPEKSALGSPLRDSNRQVDMVVNTGLVVNEGLVMVVNRQLDRHKKTDQRKEYQRDWMRKARAENSKVQRNEK